MAGHAVLDGLRAAENFTPAGFPGAATKVGVWGYSGGGQATAFAGELQPTYAPDLNLVGIAHGGAPADIPTTVRNVDGSWASGLVLAAAVGLGRAYPEMGLYALLNDAGKKMQADIGKMGLVQFAVSYPFKKLTDYTNVPNPLELPQVKAVIEENNLGHHTPTAPLFLYHARGDELNPISGSDGLFAKYCAGGGTVSYKRELIGEHITTTVVDAPAASQFLSDRIAGKPAPDDCG
jgi:hypothetical protein